MKRDLRLTSAVDCSSAFDPSGVSGLCLEPRDAAPSEVSTSIVPRILVVLALVALTGTGCSRHRDPSPDFSRASESFNKLYAQKLDDAFLDPKMREVEALLQRVPTDSLDAQASAELLSRIHEGQARMQKALDDAQAAGAAARTPSTVSNAPREQPSEDAPKPAVVPAVDAGPPQALQPTAGMSMAEFNRRFADCFQMAGPVDVQGAGARDSYDLVDSSRCRTAHPTFTDSIVVADGQAVLGVVAKSALLRPPPPPAADAGTAEAAASVGDAG
jgi:hypothetical protein